MNKNQIEIFQPDLILRKLSLENFRGFDKLEIALQADLTVLIGKNGSGKTAILDSIAKLLTDFENKIRTNGATEKKELRKVFEVLDIKTGTQKSTNTLFLSFANKEFAWKISFSKQYAQSLPHHDHLNELIERFYCQEEFNLPLMVYYPASNAPVNAIDFKNASDDFDTSVWTTYDGALDNNAFDFINFFNWYKWQENIEKQLGKNPIINVVRDAIYQILNFENQQFNQLSINWLNNPNGEMIIQKDENPLNINQLSSGEKTLLTLVADLARRLALANPHRKNPLLGNGVILIDEVDLHLHPRWQRAVIPQLQKTFPNCQLIVTTHSPLVLSQVSPQNVVILEDFKAMKNIPHTFGRDTNSLLYELMGVTQRPEKMQQKLNHGYDLIDNGQLEQAQTYFKTLSQQFLGANDPDIVHSETMINFMKD
jgi:predicted ATP-binding protein involved in virulence